MVKPGGRTPVSMQPGLWHERKELCETPCPRARMEKLMEEHSQHQWSHANSIYQVTGTKYPSKVMLTCEPKKKNSHSCIYSHYHIYSSLQDRVIPSDD